MKIKNLLSLLVICTVVGACNKKSDSNDKILTDEELLAKGANVDIESRLQPEKMDIILTAESYDEQKKLYSEFYAQNAGIGCAKNTEGIFLDEYKKNPSVVDKDLKIGDKFTIQDVNSSISDAYESSSTSTLVKIIDQQVVYNLIINNSSNIYEGSAFDIDSLFISKPHAVKTFDKLAEDGTTVYNFSKKGLDLIESMKNKNVINDSYWSCWVSEGKTSKSIVALINYEMNGKKIPAFLTEYTSAGKSKCEKRKSSTENEESKVLKTIEFENGEVVWKSIHSRMVKSNYLVPCAGERIFNQSITKINGKVVSAYASKTTAPTR